MTTNRDLVAARRSEQQLSLVAHALGVRIAIDLRRWDKARDEIDRLLEAMAIVEAALPAEVDR